MTLSANFGSETYNWSTMPNNVTSTNNEVAKLMYHCGVAVEMNYGPISSGSDPQDKKIALINYY